MVRCGAGTGFNREGERKGGEKREKKKGKKRERQVFQAVSWSIPAFLPFLPKNGCGKRMKKKKRKGKRGKKKNPPTLYTPLSAKLVKGKGKKKKKGGDISPTTASLPCGHFHTEVKNGGGGGGKRGRKKREHYLLPARKKKGGKGLLHLSLGLFLFSPNRHLWMEK